MARDNLSNSWDYVVSDRASSLVYKMKELVAYRDLILVFIRRDLISIYKQTVLGPIWYIIQPVITALIYYVLFGRFIGLETDEIPKMLFYFSGILVWTYFSKVFLKTSQTFKENSNIMGKVYFPRLSIPFSIAGSNAVTSIIQFGVFIVFFLFHYKSEVTSVININWLLMPIILIPLAFLSLGLGLLMSSITIKYRDFSYLVAFGLQLWMYATPIIYPVSYIPEKFRSFLMLNPIYPVVENFRLALFGLGDVDHYLILISWFQGILAFLIGATFFNKSEKNFIDSI